ncbi:MAG: hypothetical protein GY946_10265, partial [bacterium]|nr:hypothetical protein [bacterium]
MKLGIQQAMWMFVMVTIGIFVHATYQAYRGSELSRAPFVQTEADAESPSYQSATGTSPERPERGDAAMSTPRATASAVEGLSLYPTVAMGTRTPFDLWAYYGRGVSSFDSRFLPMRFEQWLAFHRMQKPQLMDDVRAYMSSRFEMTPRAIPGAFMSGGKPVMAGPASRLPEAAGSWEALAQLSPAEIRDRDLFP